MACENLTWDVLRNRVRVAKTVGRDMDRLTQGKVDLPTSEIKVEVNAASDYKARGEQSRDYSDQYRSPRGFTDYRDPKPQSRSPSLNRG